MVAGGAGAGERSQSLDAQPIDASRPTDPGGDAAHVRGAFGLGLGELLDVPGAASSIRVIRSADHAYDYRSDKDCRIRTLSPLNLEKDVEFYQVLLRPGGALRSAPHFAGTREFLGVNKGAVRVESGEDHEELAEGDSASYRADVPHAIELKLAAGEASLYLIVVYQ